MEDLEDEMICPERLTGRKALVIGDIMLDVHLHGVQERMSAEAPIPVFDLVSTSYNPGGAANVAVHLAHLGVEPYLVGVTGKDEASRQLEINLYKGMVEEYYFHYPDYDEFGVEYEDIEYAFRFPTTVKSRYYVNGQQVFRADHEKLIDEDDTNVHDAVVSMVDDILNKVNIDIILFQDYNKGVCSPYTVGRVMEEARKRNIPVFVDPKFKNMDAYRGAHLIKPNLKEFGQITGKEILPTKSSLDAVANQWMAEMKIAELIVTLSEYGLYFNNGHQSGIIPAIALDKPDVSGAGDAVFATIAAASLLKLSDYERAELANNAGAVACYDKGIQPLNWKDIQLPPKAIYHIL